MKIYLYAMKIFFLSQRSKAILVIGIVGISIGLISKKAISYPAGGCMKGSQEMTYKTDKEVLYKTNNLLA